MSKAYSAYREASALVADVDDVDEAISNYSQSVIASEPVFFNDSG